MFSISNFTLESTEKKVTEISNSNKNLHFDFALYSFKIIIFTHPVQVIRGN